MATTITYGSATIYNGAGTPHAGVGWSFTPGSKTNEATDVRAPQGSGIWIKDAPDGVATHVLELSWLTSSPGSLRTYLEGLQSSSLSALTVPDWGTVTRCRLAGVSPSRPTKVAGGYLIDATLVFYEYP